MFDEYSYVDESIGIAKFQPREVLNRALLIPNEVLV